MVEILIRSYFPLSVAIFIVFKEKTIKDFHFNRG